MDLPTIELVIRDGEPMYRVDHAGMSWYVADAWQAQVKAHQFAASSGAPPALVEEDGGRWGEPGV